MTYSKTESARLVREGREDDERMTPGPWKHGQWQYETQPQFHYTEIRPSDAESMAITVDAPMVNNSLGNAKVVIGGCGCCGSPFGDNASNDGAAIARTRNNLRAMCDALEAAMEEVERLTAGCTACRLENEANAEENDRLAAEVERLTKENAALENLLDKKYDAEAMQPFRDATLRDTVAENTRLSARVRELELTEEAKAALRWLRSLVEDGDCGLAGMLAVAVATLDRLTMPGAK